MKPALARTVSETVPSKVLIAVDRSEKVLGRARSLAARRGINNIVWKRGELEKLPLRDGRVEVALLSQALHHAQDPSRAVAEAVRVVVPGGRILVLDLRRHGETCVRAKLGDRIERPIPEFRALLTTDLDQLSENSVKRTVASPSDDALAFS